MANTKKSSAKKELAGTARPDRKKTPKTPASVQVVSEAKLPPSFPEPPDTLDAEGKQVYHEIAAHVRSVQGLWNVDHLMLRQAAYWVSLYIKTVRYVQNEQGGNYVQTYPTGARQISPEFSIIDKCEAHIRKYFEMLGVGAKAREMIGVFNESGGSEDQDPMVQFHKTFSTT